LEGGGFAFERHGEGSAEEMARQFGGSREGIWYRNRSWRLEKIGKFNASLNAIGVNWFKGTRCQRVRAKGVLLVRFTKLKVTGDSVVIIAV